MAVREIKTSISLDGEKEFRDAVNDANRAMRVMNAELKKIGSEFGVTGDKQQFLTQKSNNLRQAIAQQEQIVNALSGAVSDSAQKYGDAARQTDGYRIRLANATAALNRMKQELDATDREAEELGRDSTRVGRQIEDGIGDGAREAQESLSDMMRQMQEDIGSIKGSAAFTVTTQIAGGIVDVVNNLAGFVGSSRDYRRQMASLEQSARTAGMDWEDVQRFVFEITSLTGDMDGAAEAMSNLLLTGLKGQDLQNAIDLFTGANILFGGAFELGGLAGDLLESIRSGTATGLYEELLTKLGEDVESYNAAMEGLSEEERAIGSLTFLSNNGLLQTTEEFKERNSALIEAQQEQLKAQQAWAELAEELEPLSTKITEETTKFVNALTNSVKGLKGLLSGDKDAIYPDGDKDKAFSDTINAIDEYYQNPENEDSFGMEWAKFWGIVPPKYAEQEGEETAKSYMDGVKKGIQDDSIMNPEFDNPIGDWLANLLGLGSAGAEEMPEGYGEAYVNSMKQAVQEALQSGEPLPSLFDDPNLDVQFQSDGARHGASYDAGLQEAMKTAIENAKISGSNAAMGVGNGIAESSSYAVRQAWDMANGINAALASIGAGYNAPVIGRYGPSGNGDVYLDGKKVGETIAPTVNASLGKTAGRLTKVG